MSLRRPFCFWIAAGAALLGAITASVGVIAFVLISLGSNARCPSGLACAVAENRSAARGFFLIGALAGAAGSYVCFRMCQYLERTSRTEHASKEADWHPTPR